MELSHRQIKCHQVPWISLELGGRHVNWRYGSMEFHGIFHGIPCSYDVSKSNITAFHGTWRAPFQIKPGFHGISCNISWNSMEQCRHMKSHQIHDRWFCFGHYVHMILPCHRHFLWGKFIGLSMHSRYDGPVMLTLNCCLSLIAHVAMLI